MSWIVMDSRITKITAREVFARSFHYQAYFFYRCSSLVFHEWENIVLHHPVVTNLASNRKPVKFL